MYGHARSGPVLPLPPSVASVRQSRVHDLAAREPCAARPGARLDAIRAAAGAGCGDFVVRTVARRRSRMLRVPRPTARKLSCSPYSDLGGASCRLPLVLCGCSVPAAVRRLFRLPLRRIGSGLGSFRGTGRGRRGHRRRFPLGTGVTNTGLPGSRDDACQALRPRKSAVHCPARKLGGREVYWKSRGGLGCVTGKRCLGGREGERFGMARTSHRDNGPP